MSEELDPALSMDHLKKGGKTIKRSGFAAQDSEMIGDELEPKFRKDENGDNTQELSKFRTFHTEEDDDDDDEA